MCFLSQTLSANQQDYSDIEPIIVNGLINGATLENQQLLGDPHLALAAELFRTLLGQVASYNLIAIENIAQTMATCAIEPSRKSRRILEEALAQNFVCLKALKGDPSTTKRYSNCLKANTLTAKNQIDALKPEIDACLATLDTPIGNAGGSSQQQQPHVGVNTAVNVNVLVNAIVSAGSSVPTVHVQRV